MCWSRWHPLHSHSLGVHPRGDGNLLGQLHCRKWATSEKTGLSISEQQIVELLWDHNAKGRWEAEAVRAGDLSGQQRALYTKYGTAKLRCLLWFYLGSTFSVVRQSLHPVILKPVDCLTRWPGRELHFKHLTLALWAHLSWLILVSTWHIFCSSI